MDRKLGGLIVFGLLAAGGYFAYADMRASDKASAIPRTDYRTWQDLSSVDAMTDEPITTLMLLSETKILSGTGRASTPYMVLNCNSGATSLAVMTDGQRIPNGEHAVKIRMDQQPPEDRAFRSAGNDAMSATDPIPLLQQMAKSGVSKLLVRIPTAHGDRDATFNTSGMAQQVKKIETACNWE